MDKACPFCGEGDPDIDQISPGNWASVCNGCGCIGPNATTPELAGELWNQRAAVPA